MKHLKLSNGTFAIVDDEDFERLSKFTWGDKGTNIQRLINHSYKVKAFSLASEIMRKPGQMFDHINRNYRDNRKENLRQCTQNQKNSNIAKRANTSSRFKGVYWYKRDSKWMAQIMINGVRHNLGYFINEEDAARAYDMKAKELAHEFSWRNFND